MKFKYTPPPNYGDTRVLRKYAFVPVIIDGKEGKYKVWLEWYEEHSTYAYTSGGYLEGGKNKWIVTKRIQRSKLERALD